MYSFQYYDLFILRCTKIIELDMKKIAFVSLLLVSGLFSLQYTLIKSFGWGQVRNFTTQEAPVMSHYEVIYMYPSDSISQVKLDHYLRSAM
ncbi:MAG TPA: hypothetical protein DD396_04645 [Bacteroidetes bacterium]|jgi:hypothetical protein|nr:hypothetical protein [Bacteroidota bacterium]|tara:strand:+ start:869 stop:1141 length:273 start_codon:yes stop_codon:yes gene_type:complete